MSKLEKDKQSGLSFSARINFLIFFSTGILVGIAGSLIPGFLIKSFQQEFERHHFFWQLVYFPSVFLFGLFFGFGYWFLIFCLRRVFHKFFGKKDVFDDWFDKFF